MTATSSEQLRAVTGGLGALGVPDFDEQVYRAVLATPEKAA